MRVALEEIAAKSSQIARPEPGDFVIDIGCNDGTLLRSYKTPGLRLIGFEPAKNLVSDARKGTYHVFNDFFDSRLFRERFGRIHAKIITSIAMFYDLNDPHSFVADIVDCLSTKGVWVVQQNYLCSMLEQNGYDNIGHEHLTYYSLETMKRLTEEHGLEIFDVETNDINGGSFRTYISKKGVFPVTGKLTNLEKYENRLFAQRPSIYKKFVTNISKNRVRLRNFVRNQNKKGKTIYAYGASTRGNTILQYCGLDSRFLKKAADANTEKWGLRTPGTGIPIISKEEARKDKPDFFLLLPHHFLAEIFREEKQFLRDGGRFIVPLPEFRLVGMEDRIKHA